MAQYHFTIEIAGNGEEIQSAWEDACEAFALDPGDYDAEHVFKVGDIDNED